MKNKAMLLIDAPKSCAECKLARDRSYGWYSYCHPLGRDKDIFRYVRDHKIAPFCPLEIVPETTEDKSLPRRRPPMKAIFELKKVPKKCADCRFLSFAEIKDKEKPFCFFTGKLLPVDFDIKSGRAPICPLKFVMNSKETSDRCNRKEQ